MEIIDSEKQVQKNNQLWTIRLLIGAGLLTVLTVVTLTSDQAIGIPHRYQMLFPPFSILIAFALSLAGTIVGFIERRKNKRKATLGIIGNAIILILYILTVITVISSIK